jgi:recombination protein RecT
MSNEIQKAKNFVQYLDIPAVMNRLVQRLGPDNALQFKAALASAISTNPTLLTECEPESIINVGMIGHSLKLPPSPQLGYYYFVPFGVKNQPLKRATFVMGYKGYIQLAMRSGYYRRLNIIPVKEGEFLSFNPLTEEFKANFIEDPEKRETMPTTGYCGMFEYINGFTKLVYWTKKAMQNHADKYSPAYSLEKDTLLKAGKMPKGELWKYSSFWYNDFDTMALKTVIRNLLGRWGAMSVEMQQAYEKDIEHETFAEASENAQTKIEAEVGSEVVDAAFEEPHQAAQGEGMPSWMREES